MNAREGIDLAKMSIVVLLVCLVLGASLTIWYVMSDNTNRIFDKWETTTSTTTSERMLELLDMSESAVVPGSATGSTKKYYVDKLPLVTNVANALGEYNEDSLIYIKVNVNMISRNPVETITDLYTYKNDGSLVLSNTGYVNTLHDDSDTPVTQAVRQLLQYSKYRAAISMEHPTVNGSDEQFIAYVIDICVTEE